MIQEKTGVRFKTERENIKLWSENKEEKKEREKESKGHCENHLIYPFSHTGSVYRVNKKGKGDTAERKDPPAGPSKTITCTPPLLSACLSLAHSVKIYKWRILVLRDRRSIVICTLLSVSESLGFSGFWVHCTYPGFVLPHTKHVVTHCPHKRGYIRSHNTGRKDVLGYRTRSSQSFPLFHTDVTLSILTIGATFARTAFRGIGIRIWGQTPVLAASSRVPGLFRNHTNLGKFACNA